MLKETICTNMMVALSYTLKDSLGHVLDTASMGQPLVYLQGTRSIIAGLEAAVVGLKAGDTLCDVSLPPSHAYGPWNSELVQEVPRSIFPPDLQLHPGMPFSIETKHTGFIPAVWFVQEIHKDTVLLDANHPLAGKNLFVDVRVVSVRPATHVEITNGQQQVQEMTQIGWDV